MTRCTKSSCTSAPTPFPRQLVRQPDSVSAETPAADPAPPAASRGPGALPCRGQPGHLGDHRADDRLLLGGELDAARQRRETARPGPTSASPQRGAAPGGQGTGQVPVPVPWLRIPPCRPAPHPVLEQRRPHEAGQPGQPVQIPPHAGSRARLPDRRGPRRDLCLLPAGRHRPSLPARPCRRPTGRSGTATTRTSPRTRSSRPGTANGSTWTTPSTSASPTRPTGPASMTMPRRRPRWISRPRRTGRSRSGRGNG